MSQPFARKTRLARVRRVTGGRTTAGMRPVLLRALAYRGVQTLVIVVVSALLAGAATFAPWFNRLVDDSSVRQYFETDAQGSTWSLTAPTSDDLEPMLPAQANDLFEQPVTGRTADISWVSRHRVKPVEGGLVSREGACDHLVLVAGTCPSESGQVAVSDADAELYRLAPGMKVPELAAGNGEPAVFTVTGVFRLDDVDDPYWFGTVPVNRSGWRDETPLADQFLTVPETFDDSPQRRFVNRLDTRVVPTIVTVDDLPDLEAGTRQLQENARGRADVLTGMDEALDRLDESRRVSRTTLVLMAAQVGVLALAVLNMLVGLVLLARRSELGLGRLRGRPVRRLVGAVTVEWLAVVLVGSALGVGLGYVGARVARAAWLDRDPVMTLPLWVPLALAATLAVSAGLMVARCRQVAREPIPALLRTTQPRSTTSGGTQLVLDAVLVTAALAGLVVGLQSPEDSALVLLAPSLLAVAASIVLARLLAVGGAAAGRRWLARGRTSSTLAAIHLSRPRGLTALLTVLTAATAFAVFSTQVTTVSERNRDHRAEVEAGAPAVARVSAPAADAVRALDQVDPRRELATAVVTTRTDDRDFVSLMLVEPEPFRRIAYGAARLTDRDDWADIRAAAADPVELRGTRMSVVADASALFGEDGQVPAVEVVVQYRNEQGRLVSTSLGEVSKPEGARELAVDIDCDQTCELMRWRVVPDGGVSGTLALQDIDVSGEPLDLSGPPWTPVLPFDDYEMSATPGMGSLDLQFRTGGLPLAAQHAWVPVDAPVILSEEHPASATFESASVTTPGGDTLALRTIATAQDAVPRVLRDVAVGDLATALRLGERRQTDGTSTELWFSPQGVAERERLEAELAERGIRLEPVDEVGDHLAVYDGSPEALTGAVNPAAGVLAILLAVLGMILAVSASWRYRSRDLAALRMVGVPRRSLLVSTYTTQLVTVGVAVVAGTACGLLGAHLALRRLPIFADPEPAIALHLSSAPVTALVVAAGVGLLFAVVAVVSSHWLLGRSDPARIREYGA